MYIFIVRFCPSVFCFKQIITARNDNGSTMIGTGLTPEGINQNYVIYDLMTESSWRSDPANLTEWFTNYTVRRYGVYNKNLVNAWIILKACNIYIKTYSICSTFWFFHRILYTTTRVCSKCEVIMP